MSSVGLISIPVELLVNVASNLDGEDFRNFRLVNKRLAAISLHQIAKNGISLLNTAGDLKQLQKILTCTEIARNVKQLKFLHSEWPMAFSRREWETHPLFVAGNDRGQDVLPDEADKAFEAYSLFENTERKRIHSEDVDRLKSILISLPNLQSLFICHMQHCVWKPSLNTRYNNLIKRIWMSPYLGDDISPGLVFLLLALGSDFPNINKLEINGSLNPEFMVETFFKPTDIKPLALLTQIRVLHVDSFRVIQNENSIIKFLEAFPNVSNASIKFQGWGPAISIIGTVKWTNIGDLQLSGLWTSEEEIFQTFQNHHKTLKSFTLRSSALTEGSWRSLFTRIRGLNSGVQVIGEGELYGRTRRETLNLHLPTISTSLVKFIEDHTVDWPF